MPLQLDTGKESLDMFFKDWQEESLRYLWGIQPEGANSRAVWLNVNESLEGSISRTSIINFLNDMVDEELLSYTETTGKGGHHRVWRNRIQATYRGPHNLKAAQRIPAGNSESAPSITQTYSKLYLIN